jgi:hypothetical protein
MRVGVAQTQTAATTSEIARRIRLWVAPDEGTMLTRSVVGPSMVFTCTCDALSFFT